MNRVYRLRQSSQFQYVYRRGKAVSNGRLSVLYVRSGALRVGFSIGKKMGKAVRRNRLKRRLRELFAPHIPELKPGLYVVAAREGAKEASFRELGDSLEQLLRRGRLYREAR